MYYLLAFVSGLAVGCLIMTIVYESVSEEI